MSDSQQPGAAGDDQIPPIPHAPSAEVPPVPPAPATPDAETPASADASPVPEAAAAEPYAAPEPVNPYAPPATTVPSSAPADPAPPVAPAAPEPMNPSAPSATPVAPAAPAPANPYVAPVNPYAAPAAPGASPAYAATPAYAAGPTGPSRFNVMGLVSLILGGVAFLFGVTIGWIPYVGFFFVLLALVGVALGIVGLIAKNKGKGLAIAGTIVSGIALLLTAIISIMMLMFVLSFSNTVDDFGDDPVITDPDGGTTGGDSDDPNALGSQNNPAAVGDTVTFTDYDGTDQWAVVVGTPNLDATADVLAAYEYNTAPEAGNSYIVVPMTVTFLGSGSDLPYMLLAEYLGADGQLYELS